MSWLKKDRLQYEFLPAAEEIIETPAAPRGAMVIWLVTILLVVAGVWSYVGQIDIVAVANGRISTEGSTKIIQPAISGVVTKINTREGQEVKKGDALIELDKTTVEKEVMTLVQGVAVARVERDILRRLAAGGAADDIITQAELPGEVKSVLREFAQARQGLIQARQQTLHGAISQQRQQVQFNQHAKQRLEANMQQLQQRKRELESQLAQANPVERIGLQNELGSLEQRIAAAESAVLGQGQQALQSQSALAQAQQQLQTNRADINNAFFAEIITQEKRIVELENALTKARQALTHTTITAPVDGTVLLLATKTIGGVVNPAERIAEVVPKKVPLYVDTTLENQDIGFVKQGQRVVVKLATYPFQRYGYLEGEVETISPDAIHDEKKGLVYKAKIKLKNATSSKQTELTLLPGMSVSAEITTGKRRIVEFFLDPLLTKVDGSLHVR